jgi:hypothetical protein
LFYGSIDQRFLDGSFLRLIDAKSFNCFSVIDSAICFEAPFRLLFFCSPRFAARAAPAQTSFALDFLSAGQTPNAKRGTPNAKR